MRHTPLPASFFTENRARLAALLPPGSLVVIQANDRMPTSGDGTLPFRQNSDLYYLTGVDQEDTVLVLFPDANLPEDREILFVRETSELIAIWEGEMLDKPQATARSGVQEISWSHAFESVVRRLMCQAENVFLHTNEHLRCSNPVETRNSRFIRWCQKEFPLHTYRRVAPLLNRLRMTKTPAEIEALRKAIAITRDGFLRVAGKLTPGVMEYEIEAEFAHEFLRQGSRGFAYEPIIASGASSCVLHYASNDKICQPGDLLLLDVGAEYAAYNADLSRSLPVDGKFTPRQRAVYDAVLRVHREASKRLRPGVLLRDYQKEIEALMTEECLSLGLLTAEEVAKQDPKKPAVKKYFMHGTSHHLGLDVHDVAPPDFPVQAGMVFTVEPGLYLRAENIGIRLENNFLIGEEGTGNTDLMESIPIEAEEIESLMVR